MKVVLFCGGRGLRLREHSEAIPKPMVQIGYRPILWHVMRYYAHFGHRDFILCLGYRGDAIKDYFLHYDEAVSNDFVLSEGGRHIELLGSDIADWRITFADTGLDTTIGERLRRVRHLLEGEEMFLANYGDTLTDAPLDRLVEDFRGGDAAAALLSVRPSYSFHVVKTDDDGRRHGAARRGVSRSPGQRRRVPVPGRDLRSPGSGEDLVDAPFASLAADRTPCRISVRRLLGVARHPQGPRASSSPSRSVIPRRGPCGAAPPATGAVSEWVGRATFTRRRAGVSRERHVHECSLRRTMRRAPRRPNGRRGRPARRAIRSISAGQAYRRLSGRILVLRSDGEYRTSIVCRARSWRAASTSIPSSSSARAPGASRPSSACGRARIPRRMRTPSGAR